MSGRGIRIALEARRAVRFTVALIVLVPAIAQAQDLDVPGLKSEETALWLSLGSTAVPLVAGIALAAAADDEGTGAGPLIASAGLYFGPAVGYFYGGAAGRGWKGVGIRFGTGLVTALGVVAICGGADGENCSIFDSSDDDNLAAASIVALAGLAAITFSAVYDIAKVKSHVRQANQKKLSRTEPALSLAPVVSPVGGGTVGIVGQLRF